MDKVATDKARGPGYEKSFTHDWCFNSWSISIKAARQGWLRALAFLIATPIAYLAMNRWLDTFAYRIEISGWIFLVAGLSALLVALLTVSYQAIRAALTDPVKALRYE